MGIAKIETWIHDRILKNDKIRHFVYGFYQRVLWLFSKKIKYEGDIERISPNDNFEYFFGYYDKCPWSPNKENIIFLKVKCASKKPDSDEIGSIIVKNISNQATKEVAITHCWNVQQGCMAQWIDDSHIIYNDFRDNRYVGVLLNINTGNERVYKMPIYSVSNDKKIALTLDFSRLHRLRPGYGYSNIDAKSNDEKCPDEPCIWRIDLNSGVVSPVLKYTDLLSFETRDEMIDSIHKVNHIMFSPDGERFMFLHRWIRRGRKYTRLITCKIDGTDLFNLSDDDFVSHCCWKDNTTILSYLNKKSEGKAYYLMTDKTKNYVRLWPELVFDGHPTFSHDGKYVITDTYPDRKRIQSIYLMNENKVKRVARVFASFKYANDCRCDLHPRWSFDDNYICFDGSFEGKRAVYQLKLKKGQSYEE